MSLIPFWLFFGILAYFGTKWLLTFRTVPHDVRINYFLLAVEGGALLFIILQLFFGLGASRDPPLWAQIFGMIFFMLGVSTAITGRIMLASDYRPAAAIDKPAHLVTRGPYHYIRHPIYSGTLAMALGFEIALWSNLLFLVLLTIPVFIWQINREEKLLSSAFSHQWRRYRDATSYRLIPCIF